MAICADTPEAIRKGRSKHGARAILLSDADLAVTDQYNLRNEGNLSPKGIGPLPIPTTFLVDEDGLVRWIDQAEDYQVRSHPDRVLGAIQGSLS